MKKALISAGVIFTFIGIGVIVFFLVRSGIIEPAVGLLMLICLVGIYVGFGILIAVYRLVNRLQ